MSRRARWLGVPAAGGALLFLLATSEVSQPLWDSIRTIYRSRGSSEDLEWPWREIIVGPVATVYNADINQMEIACLHVDPIAFGQWARVTLPPAESRQLSALLFPDGSHPQPVELTVDHSRVRVERVGPAWRLTFTPG